MLQRVKEILSRLTWGVVLVLVGGGAAYFYYTVDNTDLDARREAIESQKRNITNTTHKIQEAEEFQKQFEEKKKHYAELVKQLQDLKEALPRQFFLPDLLSDVLREAKQVEVEVLKIVPDAAYNQGELYNTLGFQLETRGTFLQFFIFLDRLAHMQRLINVENFSIGKDAGHPSIPLGGAEGVFSGSKLTGGRRLMTGISASARLLTYSYRGAPGGDAAATPPPVSGGKK